MATTQQEKMRAYRSKYATEWNKAHKELHAARCKRWRQNNREKVKKLKKEWRQKQKFKKKYGEVAKECALKAAIRV
jgi:DNA-binding helix-hairpin-helix protein with protein kinase domain